MDTEAQPKDLRIRYDRSTSYAIPMPMVAVKASNTCQCKTCQAGALAIFADDWSEWQDAVQLFVDWLLDRRSFPDDFQLCVQQTHKLAAWLKRQRSDAS